MQHTITSHVDHQMFHCVSTDHVTDCPYAGDWAGIISVSPPSQVYKSPVLVRATECWKTQSIDTAGRAEATCLPPPVGSGSADHPSQLCLHAGLYRKV